MALNGYSLPETLTDDGGNALKDITVTVTGPSAYSGTATTDAISGVLRLGPLPIGDYVVSYQGRSVTIPVVPAAVDVQTAFDKAAAAVPLTQRGAANGVATLDGAGTIPDAQIPAGIARDTEVSAAVAALVNSAPGTLDTLGELAAALQSDEGAAAALTTAVGQRGIVVNHGAVAGTARPTSSLPVAWYGTVAPTNAATNDTWDDQVNDLRKRWSGTAWVAAGSGTYVQVVEHGATAGTARPAGAIRAYWRGTVAPTNATQYDRWVNTTSAPYIESIYNGASWDVLGAATFGTLLGQSLADVAVVSSAVETALAQFNLPIAPVPGATMRLTAAGDYLNNTGGTLTSNMRLKLGGTVLTDSVLAVGTNALRRNWIFDATIMLGGASQGAASDLRMTIASAGGTLTNSFSLQGYGASAEDLTVQKILALNVQHPVSNANLELRVHMVALTQFPKS